MIFGGKKAQAYKAVAAHSTFQSCLGSEESALAVKAERLGEKSAACIRGVEACWEIPRCQIIRCLEINADETRIRSGPVHMQGGGARVAIELEAGEDQRCGWAAG